MVKIAHASISENGDAGRNGKAKAGDQTGKEVCIRSWYSKPWNCVIRFKESKLANLCADAMTFAAQNDNIGYDQTQRNTLLTQARKYNFDIRRVTQPCETDCSALVSVACMYAGIPESYLTVSGNCATTRNLRSLLKNTGKVDVYTSALYTTKKEKLKRGDILLKEGSHVAVVIEVDENPYKLTAKLLEFGSKGNSVKWLQTELNRYGYNLEVDGDFGYETSKAVMDYQKNHASPDGKKLKVDGVVGKNTIAALKGAYDG